MSSNLISFNYCRQGRTIRVHSWQRTPTPIDAMRSLEIVNLIAAQLAQQFLRTRILSEQDIRHPCCGHEPADVETHRWSLPEVWMLQPSEL